MNAEVAIKSVKGACPRKRTMSRSEADEMLERKKFPHAVTFSNQKLKSIGIYASQIIDQVTFRQANQLKKLMKKTKN